MKIKVERNFSSRLVEYMKENNLTKKQLAQLCGLTICRLNEFLADKNVSATTIVKISRATKISVDELLGLN